jgi:hypothetical protein
MDITTYDKKEIRPGFEKASEMMSVALSVRKNREEALGTHLADLIPSLRVVCLESPPVPAPPPTV